MRVLVILLLLVGVAVAGETREQATDTLNSQLAALAARARTHEREADEYLAGCRGSATVNTNTEVLGSIDVSELPECRTRLARYEGEARAIRSDLDRAREAARRAGVTPGAVRDAIKRNGLDDYTSPLPEPQLHGGELHH